MSVFSEHVWLEPCFWVVMVVNLHVIFHKVQKSLREFRVLGSLSFSLMRSAGCLIVSQRWIPDRPNGCT